MLQFPIPRRFRPSTKKREAREKKKKRRNDHTTKMFISRNILSLLLSLLPASAEKPALTQSWNKVQNPLMDKI